MGRVIFLGTGDPLNEERAQACLAVPLAENETILIDAASGGTVLLGRLDDAGIPPESVRHLFVTHRHFDHVGGLAPLLVSLVSLPEASITVHATPGTLAALRELLAITIPGVEDWMGERLRWGKLAPESRSWRETPKSSLLRWITGSSASASASRRTVPRSYTLRIPARIGR